MSEKRRNGLTRQDKMAPKFPDLVERDFTAAAPNCTWVGIRHDRDPDRVRAAVFGYRDRSLQSPAAGCGHGVTPGCRAGVRGYQNGCGRPWWSSSDLARRGVRAGHIPHRSRQHLYRWAIHQTVPAVGDPAVDGSGRVGSRFDNAAEAFFSSLEWEALFHNSFNDTIQAQAVIIDWRYTFYNHQCRHSAADGLSPVNYEIGESKTKPEAA